jgi:hypothetical protein
VDERQLKDLRPTKDKRTTLSDWVASIVPLILICVFAALLYGGFRQAQTSLLNEGLQVFGTVTEAHEIRGVHYTVHHVTASYKVDNRTFTLVDEGTLPANNHYQFGEKIPIIYLPSNPAEATFDPHKKSRSGEVTMLLSGIGILICASYAFANFRRTQTKRLNP